MIHVELNSTENSMFYPLQTILRGLIDETRTKDELI